MGVGVEERVRSAAERVVVTSESMPLCVQYGVRPELLIAQAGYSCVTEYACWPYLTPRGAGTVLYEACRFVFGGGCLSGAEAYAHIARYDRARPWRPANVTAILSFGVQYPTVQMSRPVVGLDAWLAVPNGEHYLYLDKVLVDHPTHRMSFPKTALLLWDRTLGWPPGTEFLAIRRR